MSSHSGTPAVWSGRWTHWSPGGATVSTLEGAVVGPAEDTVMYGAVHLARGRGVRAHAVAHSGTVHAGAAGIVGAEVGAVEVSRVRCGVNEFCIR